MIGTSVYFNLEKAEDEVVCSKNVYPEKYHVKEEIYCGENLKMFVTGYNGYPVTKYIDENVIILIEGMIYNKENDDILEFCKSLNGDISTVKQDVSKFINGTDGDYLISIYSKSTNTYFIFNDIIGRLPFYYYSGRTMFLGSRSIPFILDNIPEIKMNINVMTEFLMTEYIIGDKTMINDVHQMDPGSLMVVRKDDNEIKKCVYKLDTNTFDTQNPFANCSEAIDYLNQEYEINTKNRLDKLVKEGFSINNTLSGGYDSRAVFGMLNNLTEEFNNITYEYIQDESEIAKAVIRKTGSKSNYIKLSFNNEIDYYNSELIFNTGGRVNIYTSSICYNDSKYKKDMALIGKCSEFMGFGGELIRHPYIPLTAGPNDYLCYLFPQLQINYVAPIFNTDSKSYRKHLDETLSNYNEKTREGVYRHLYNEYYRNYVVCAGEDRERMFAWTVQPLMSTSLVIAIRNRIPLKWINNDFFEQFLVKIDDRLLNEPIYKGKAELTVKKNRRISFLKTIIPRSLNTYRRIIKNKYLWKFINKKPVKYEKDEIFKAFDGFYHKLSSSSSLINYSYVIRNYGTWPFSTRARLLTITMYLFELENKYGNKLNK